MLDDAKLVKIASAISAFSGLADLFAVMLETHLWMSSSSRTVDVCLVASFLSLLQAIIMMTERRSFMHVAS